MSESKTFAVSKGLATRIRDNGAQQGAGDCKRHYVGLYSGDRHKGYLEFTLDWTNVKTIVSAVLTLYADDGLGLLGDTMPSGSPYIKVQRLKQEFSEGGGSASFTSDDWDDPDATTTGEKGARPSRAPLEPVNIDITAIVRAWAPSTVTGGGQATNHGIRIIGNNDGANNYAYISEDAEAGVAAYKPIITLTYEYGLTAPNTPSNLSPSGAVAALSSFQGSFSDIKTTDKLARSQVQVYTSAATNTGQTVTGGTLLYDIDAPESESASLTGIFDHVPTTTAWLATGTTYKWRGRVKDQEGQWSLYTDLTSFSVTNTAPTAPVLDPADAASFASLDGIYFSAPFVDADAGDTLLAYQIELSDVAEGNPSWDDPNHIYWETGKRYVAVGSEEFRVPYGGAGLAAGTYYWRARVWDNHQSASDWEYASIVITDSFVVDPSTSTNAIASRPRAPWRILIKEMKYNTVGTTVTGNATTDLLTTATAHNLVVGQPVRFGSLTGGSALVVGTTYYVKTVPSVTTLTISATDGGATQDLGSNVTATSTLTAVTTRGPGNTVAVLEDAMNVGASLLYNSPGEMHFTLGADHPQLPLIEPKQTHYAVEFRQGDGWREVFQGLVWDYDASDNDIVFYGIDYLGLLDYVMDEHYDPANIDKPYTSGGSKYVSTAISTIITNQLTRSREDRNSPVGFISTGSIASFTETVTVYSTYQPTLNFIVGLIDSHRAGQNRRSRLYVKKTATNTYQWVLEDNPGVVRDNLRLRFGELVQGYRVIPFGNAWASRISAIGRDKDGVRIRYATKSGTGINEAVWGKFSQPMFIDGVSDANDFIRRVQQAAQAAGKLGKQVALGIRSGFLLPRDGYDLLDQFPVDIEDGAVATSNWGSGYWTAVGITWTALQRGDLNTTLTLHPREDDTAPSNDLLTAHNISTTAEWQVGWTPPTVVTPTSRYWLDNTTGIVYERVGGTLIKSGITGTI